MRSDVELIRLMSLGEHLTDEELIRLRDLYAHVARAAQPFGLRYEVIRVDSILKVGEIEKFLWNRKATGWEPTRLK